MSNLDTYSLIVDGMTQEDIAFRDAVRELDSRADFYTRKINTQNRLNQWSVGIQPDETKLVDVVGMVDFRENQITLTELDGEHTYNMDEFDPRYLRYLNQNVQLQGRNPDRLPVTRMALDLLNEQLEDVEVDKRLPLDDVVTPQTTLSGSSKQLQKAFNNEMLLLVQLDDYIKKNDLENVVGEHKDKMSHLVGHHAYDFDFQDSVEKLNQEALEMLSPDLARG